MDAMTILISKRTMRKERPRLCTANFQPDLVLVGGGRPLGDVSVCVVRDIALLISRSWSQLQEKVSEIE